MAREIDIAPRITSHIIKQDLRLGTFKRQTGQRHTVALKENRKESRRLLLYGKERYKEILITDEKIVLYRKLSISKTIEFMHGHPRKPANWCQGSNEVILFGGECLMTASLLYSFCEKSVKTAARNYQLDI